MRRYLNKWYAVANWRHAGAQAWHFPFALTTIHTIKMLKDGKIFT